MSLDLLTSPGTAPSRSQTAEQFNANADAFVVWLANFVNQLNGAVPDLNTLISLAQPAIDAATTALQAPGTMASSTTSVAIPAAVPVNLSFTIEPGKLYIPGMTLDAIATAAPDNHITGKIVSYNSSTGALVLRAIVAEGSGTWNSWTLALAASPMTTTRNPIVAKSANFTLSAADKGCVFVCSAALTISAPATLSDLGSDFYCWVLNEGTLPVGIVNGATTVKALAPRQDTLVMCDGTSIKTVDSDPKSTQSKVTGLTGTLNTTTPTSKYDLTAKQITFTNANGDTILKGPFTATVDLNLAGPAANGRGQAGAFANSSWVHLYAIINQTTGAMASLASTLDPWSFTTAQLPTGYTHWAYLTTIYKNSSGAIQWTIARGSYQLFATNQLLVSLTAATGEGNAALTSLVPPIATNYVLGAQLYVDSTSAGNALVSCGIRAVSGNDSIVQNANCGPSSNAYNTGSWVMPNLSPLNYQATTAGAINSFALTLRVHGFFVPNGDN